MANKTLNQNIPKGWSEVTFEDVMTFERPDNYIVKSTVYSHTAKTPVLTANKSFILGYTDEEFGIYEKTPSVIFDDFTTDSKFVDFPFKIKSSAIKILKSRDEKKANLKFLHEVMSSIKFPVGNHKRYYISQYQKQNIWLPPLKEQQKIAGIFEAVDVDIEETESIIKATEKLKKGLMQEFFTRGIGHTKFKQTELGEMPESWKSVNLEDVAELSTGTTPSTSKTSYYEGNVPFIKTGQVVNNRITSAEVSISEDAVKDYRLKKYKPGTVLMAMYGQGKTRGQVALLEIDACTTQNAAAIEPDQNLNSEYLWFYFKSQYEQLRRGGVQGHISHLNLTVLKKVQLPLPSLSEQKAITDILVAVEEKIQVNKKLLAKQTELKKGLMQDLLSGVKRVSLYE